MDAAVHCKIDGPQNSMPCVEAADLFEEYTCLLFRNGNPIIRGAVSEFAVFQRRSEWLDQLKTFGTAHLKACYRGLAVLLDPDVFVSRLIRLI